MSQEQRLIRIAIGENLWTRALVDDSVRVDGFAVEFHSKVTLPDRLHGVREGKWHGSQWVSASERTSIIGDQDEI
jgi:hypothetical protein